MRPFWKYHGCGNDFVLVEDLEARSTFSLDAVRRLCDRHLGVGADGLLAVRRGEADRLRMDYWNSDGTVAEMCGNGIRCFVKHVRDRGLATTDELDVETGAGVRRCTATPGPDGRVAAVRVDMGAPAPLDGADPGDRRGWLAGRTLALDGRTLDLVTVSMGNPHAVHFTEGATMELARLLGPTVERHESFPERTNVEFARIRDRRIVDLVVWERGCGITLACGTGACATVVAGVLAERLVAGEAVAVNLPGGTLDVEVAADLSQVWLRGPAVRVFEGRWPEQAAGEAA